MNNKDDLFQNIARPEDFAFDEKVAGVFDDMISRSIPYYDQVQQMQADLVLDFLSSEAQSNIVCDLGCSTGTTLKLVLENPECPQNIQCVGYDNSAPMLDIANEKLSHYIKLDKAELHQADFSELTTFPTTNVVIMNWTLQFIRPLDRLTVVKKIYDALAVGGALFLSEKILGSSPRLNRLYIEHYLNYKKAQGGYSDVENQRKREALENVLIPYRLDENEKLLQQAGFKKIDTYFRWLNFACLVAIKD